MFAIKLLDTYLILPIFESASLFNIAWIHRFAFKYMFAGAICDQIFQKCSVERSKDFSYSNFFCIRQNQKIL